jgi:hypothetical protein
MNAPHIHVGFSSPPDRGGLVADLMIANIQLAEVNLETGQPIVELYCRPDGSPWRVPADELLRAIREACQRLGPGEG